MEKRVLIARWFGPDVEPLPIYDEASVSSARQRVREAGHHLNLRHELVESVALIASELTHNQLAHAKQGYFDVKPFERLGALGLEVTAADLGPGIESPRLALQDDFTTRPSALGVGLGSVSRLADEVEFDNRLSEGVCVIARKFESPFHGPYEAAVMGRPFPGEAISGDDAVFVQTETGFIAAVSDGLGHGPEARHASNLAIEVLSRNREMDLEEIVQRLNDELSFSRGCAMCIARFNENTRVLECVSAGDVHAHLYNLRTAHFFTATPLVLGAGRLPKQRVRVENTNVEAGSVLLLFTDGLKSKTTLKGQLDTLRLPAILIAEHLLQNDSRPDDDALVLIVRFRR
jgi:anti-sigma regulatory factor (Ser/Thr protein kinase)